MAILFLSITIVIQSIDIFYWLLIGLSLKPERIQRCCGAREIIHQRAGGCCEYCQTCEVNIGQTMHVEHIKPGGGDHLDNLCLACPNCNLSKATAVKVIVPKTGEEVSLFNPRMQTWEEHFEWEDNYAQIYGVTPIGRATVKCFKMNRPRMVLTRRRWVQAGLHPVV